ncbi:alanine:cation symporter family protein [Pseudomaricurvus alkylphenolicus]|uniref:alanine/glycine:cation symporter family protein n=1 Tax=Pseudomaricurvus alkylphenolicus TaxID=1306991 RepID=UPI00141F60A0|nr:alanine/glycine:cation symporter family protein [Pseudomaricurvus alkylphenolicus]NIB38437.1 alanine:cation symporter family protein [Pseudomaricurvus alkylphenolicus]
MQAFVEFTAGMIWSPALIALCLGAGLFYSVITRFVQIRLFREMLLLLVKGKSSRTGISSFQALAVSLSGRVGTGNIAGVAAAIGFGGPGAVFWMWIVAFLGAATAYAESTLAQIYKETDEGQYRGGPAYYFEKALGAKWYSWIFAIATIIATGVLMPGVQSNGIGNAVVLVAGEGSLISLPVFGDVGSTKLVTASIICGLLAFIVLGGVKRIAKFTEVVVPVMAMTYLITAFVVIALNIDELPRIVGMIVGDAFSPMAGVGAAIGWGVKRGIYSNEAGQGTGPHAAAAAEVQHPAQQGLVQAFSIYIDTLVVCTATAFMILITGAYNVHGLGDAYIVQNELANGLLANSPQFTQMAIESIFPGVGKPSVAIALFFFSFTTLLAYYYIAETNVAYIHKSIRVPGLTAALKVGILLATFYGTIKTANLAWGLGDIAVGAMAWLNIIGVMTIFFVAKPAIKALRDYERQRREGVENYTFDPLKLGIANAEFWEGKIEASESRLQDSEGLELKGSQKTELEIRIETST